MVVFRIHKMSNGLETLYSAFICDGVTVCTNELDVIEFVITNGL